jgi:hypothetical protein
MHHKEKYYIEVNDEEIEVEVLWNVTLDKQSRKSGDGWESFTEVDFEIINVQNLSSDEHDVWYPANDIAYLDWEKAFERADADGRIQCYVQF